MEVLFQQELNLWLMVWICHCDLRLLKSMSNYLQEHSTDSNIDRTTSPSQKLHKAQWSIHLSICFQPKKTRCFVCISAFGVLLPTNRKGVLVVFSGNQLADHRRLKLMAPKVWEMLGRGMFFKLFCLVARLLKMVPRLCPFSWGFCDK